jgi:hypothetical protein
LRNSGRVAIRRERLALMPTRKFLNRFVRSKLRQIRSRAPADKKFQPRQTVLRLASGQRWRKRMPTVSLQMRASADLPIMRRLNGSWSSPQSFNVWVTGLFGSRANSRAAKRTDTFECVNKSAARFGLRVVVNRDVETGLQFLVDQETRRKFAEPRIMLSPEFEI